jgi:YggT family protein
MSAIHDAMIFLITTIFDMYLFILTIRVILAFSGANYYDPMTQFIVRCTDFAVKPLRRVIPNVRGIEISTILLILILAFVKYSFLAALSFSSFSVIGIAIIAIADTMKLFLQTYFYAIIIQAVLSWVQPGSPVNMLLYRITAPILRPIQRVIPTVGGMDLSPIAAMILLQLLIIVIVNPLMAIGIGASLG